MMPPKIGARARRGATCVAALWATVLAGACRRDTAVVAMRDNTFDAPVLHVATGARLRFDNAGLAAHNVVIADSATAPFPANPPVIAPGKSQRLEFDKPGVYRIYCSFHGTPDGRGMAAVVVVGDGR
ncbi:MAG: cupredoxin domain-containing protein [Gemmatimonadaceae bacterium]